MARSGKPDKALRSIPPISQKTLAEMIGTTRSRVNVLMNKFERRGFINCRNGLRINNSLLDVVLSD